MSQWISFFQAGVYDFFAHEGDYRILCGNLARILRVESRVRQLVCIDAKNKPSLKTVCLKIRLKWCPYEGVFQNMKIAIETVIIFKEVKACWYYKFIQLKQIW